MTCIQISAARSQTLDLSNPCARTRPFSFSTPSAEGLDVDRLIALTRWIEASKEPVLSVLISRNGRLVCEAYPGGGSRNQAHYLMSVTKSVVSALVGVALHDGLVASIDEPLTRILPARYFGAPEQRKRMSRVTLRHALTMSALDAQTTPRLMSDEGRSRQRAYFDADDRLAFALSQKILPRPGADFQYTDITTSIQGGVIQHVAGTTLLDYAQTHIFDPLSFSNADWMHQDTRGQEMAGYGLRLRPIDMQKFGILYMNRGCAGGRRLIDAAWIDESTRGAIRSYAAARWPNYGLGWWMIDVDGHAGYEANGWKGQRIMIFPDDGLVVTATAVIEKDEAQFYPEMLRKFVFPALDPKSSSSNKPSPSETSSKDAELAELIKAVNEQPPRLPSTVEYRMVPQVEAKALHRPYRAQFK